MPTARVSLVCMVALLWGCEQRSTATSTSAATSTAPAQTTSSSSSTAPSSAPQPAPSLDPAAGSEVGLVVEAYLSPHQESNEEENTPSSVPQQFRSTTPSQTRAQREAAGHRGHGTVRFSRDFSRAWVDVRVEGVDLAKVNMFHIHCGDPGILGPIVVDFALATDVNDNLADGLFSVELRNEHIAGTAAQGDGHGPVAGFTRGCVIGSPSLESMKPAKVTTVAGLAELAVERQLYFNLHTTGQVYYGDIRGQLWPVVK
jgi:CHRD domain-containing protein